MANLMHIFCTSLFSLRPDYYKNVSFQTFTMLTVSLGQGKEQHMYYETHSSKLHYVGQFLLLSHSHP